LGWAELGSFLKLVVEQLVVDWTSDDGHQFSVSVGDLHERSSKGRYFIVGEAC
jgi:hypothetical protein